MPATSNKAIGLRIRRWRVIIAHMDVSDMATRLGISASALRSYELGD